MDQPAWIDHLSKVIAKDKILTAASVINEHSCDCWPVAIKWQMQNKQLNRPDVVIKVTSTEEVSTVLEWANRNKIYVTPYGLGSGVCGAAIPTQGGISLDMSLMREVIAVDKHAHMVTVQGGKLGIELEQELNKEGFTLNHSPQSLDRSTVAGWVATRAIGQLSSKYGGIEDLCVAYQAVLPDGMLYQTKMTPRQAVGPDLRHLLMGSEGSLGVITEVTLRIFPITTFRLYETLTFASVSEGVDAMRRFMQAGLRPFIVRFYDPEEAKHAMQDETFEQCVMFLGFDGIESVATAEYNACIELCEQSGAISKLGEKAVLKWLDRRYDFSTVERLLLSPGGLAETIEISHHWEGIVMTYQRLKEALSPYAREVLGHFSHVYTHGSSLYIILLGQEANDAEAEEALQAIWKTAMSICLETGASISHHHGAGLARAPYVQECLGSSHPLLQRVKEALDPNGIMNPGKLGLS